MNNKLLDIVDIVNRNNYKLAITKLCEYLDEMNFKELEQKKITFPRVKKNNTKKIGDDVYGE